ncbi:carbohydrate ABC transporter permease [Jiangella ureilytica]|uniref:Carbohydrate ABC transporter permease n=1 Tax=Jiangella ureilytica TaxID=2530374 RepID=A0A4R4RA29_9ACTN|nr:carbohydrate ABC transporter permease [Jiangella ureilytica]TDC45837.1 carbohydrate ABC transporter permease [Jiangella ureilytica]
MKPSTAVTVTRYTAILVIGLAMGLPLFYLFSSSLMTPQDVSAYPPHLVPPEFRWANFSDAYDFLGGRTIANSFIYSFGIVILQLCIALPAGFALAKVRFRGSRALLVFFAIPMFLPNNVVLVPLYVVTNELGLIGSYAGLILPIVGRTAFATLLFRQFFLTLPDGLIDAAKLDRAGWLRIVRHVAVPLSGPAVAAYASITFLNSWNDFIWPLVAAPGDDYRVMTVALAPLAYQEGLSNVPPNVGMAAAVISVIPVLLVFVFTQRWYIQGVVGTGTDNT